MQQVGRGGVGRVDLVVEPGLVPALSGVPLQWQYAAVHADQVPPEVAQAAAKLTIARRPGARLVSSPASSARSVLGAARRTS